MPPAAPFPPLPPLPPSAVPIGSPGAPPSPPSPQIPPSPPSPPWPPDAVFAMNSVRVMVTLAPAALWIAPPWPAPPPPPRPPGPASPPASSGAAGAAGRVSGATGAPEPAIAPIAAERREPPEAAARLVALERAVRDLQRAGIVDGAAPAVVCRTAVRCITEALVPGEAAAPDIASPVDRRARARRSRR